MGSKGFSLNVKLNVDFVCLFFGFPPNSVFKQSIYTGLESIDKKVNNPEDIIEFYRTSLEHLGCFGRVGKNLKWVIDKTYSEDEISSTLSDFAGGRKEEILLQGSKF